MKILVIGKNGFVSTSFQQYMKKYENIEVTAISARNQGWKDQDFSKYDAVYNATGLAHDDARKGTDEQFMDLNCKLPVELAKKAKAEGVKTFINMSSIIIYGDMSELGSKALITENTVPTPAGIYGRSKLAGEKELQKLNDESFHVAIIRSPLIYSEHAVDNFLKLTSYAVKYPIFPKINNRRSMIYSDNLCELVKLIAENNSEGTFYPQQDRYICTSKLVRDVAAAAKSKMMLTKVFNPVIYVASKKVMFIRKVFGSLAYDMELSNVFDGKYKVVDYKESIRRIAATKN